MSPTESMQLGGALLRKMAGMSISKMQGDFITWLLTPKPERDPATQEQLAEFFGISSWTLSNWKKDPEFIEAWNASYLTGIGSPESKSDIMTTLLRTATDPDDPKHVQAAKAYFEIEGSLRPTRNQVDIKVSSTPASELSDEELQRLLAERADDELAKRRDVS